MRPFTRHLVGLALTVWLAATAGCAVPTVEARIDVPRAVNSGLHVFEDRATRERVVQVVSSAEMQEAIRELAAGLVDGVKDKLIDDQVEARATELATRIAATATRAAVAAALAEASSPANAKRMQEMVTAATIAATHAALQTVATEVPQTVGPAMGTMLQAQLHDPQTQQALNSLAFEMSRQAVFGTNQGMADIAGKRATKGTLAKVSGWISASAWVIPLTLSVLLASIVALAVGFLRSRSEARRYKHEIEAHAHEPETRGAAT